MNMKDMIQRMTEIDKSKAQLTESAVNECGEPMPAPEMDRGNPVSINVSMNASGREHVEDLLDMMKKAGLGSAEEVKPDMMPMRMDMEKFRSVVDGPKDDKPVMKLPAPEEMDMEDDIDEEGYENEPDEEYKDTKYMTKDLSGGLNREKKAYKAAQRGDNAMAVETLYNELMSQYKSK
jgi:hypothetical protein